jgi:mRNA interferase RelE/StbE
LSLPGGVFQPGEVVVSSVLGKDLQIFPWPQDARPLRGFSDVWRVDQGEYRLAYTVDKDETLVTVWAIGKRNDEEVYKLLKRRLG